MMELEFWLSVMLLSIVIFLQIVFVWRLRCEEHRPLEPGIIVTVPSRLLRRYPHFFLSFGAFMFLVAVIEFAKAEPNVESAWTAFGFGTFVAVVAGIGLALIPMYTLRLENDCLYLTRPLRRQRIFPAAQVRRIELIQDGVWYLDENQVRLFGMELYARHLGEIHRRLFALGATIAHPELVKDTPAGGPGEQFKTNGNSWSQSDLAIFSSEQQAVLVGLGRDYRFGIPTRRRRALIGLLIGTAVLALIFVVITSLDSDDPREGMLLILIIFLPFFLFFRSKRHYDELSDFDDVHLGLKICRDDPRVRGSARIARRELIMVSVLLISVGLMLVAIGKFAGLDIPYPNMESMELVTGTIASARKSETNGDFIEIDLAEDNVSYRVETKYTDFFAWDEFVADCDSGDTIEMRADPQIHEGSDSDVRFMWTYSVSVNGTTYLDDAGIAAGFARNRGFSFGILIVGVLMSVTGISCLIVGVPHFRQRESQESIEI